MAHRYLPIAALVGLYFIAAQIGSGFSQILTIFSLFVWVIAGGLFLYLILFRGLKIQLFRNSTNDNSPDYELLGENRKGQDHEGDKAPDTNVHKLPRGD